jgi:membrane dipeptidase
MAAEWDRRTLVGALAALAPGVALAKGRSAPDAAARLVGRAMVINGNLLAPLDSEKALGVADVRALRASGLTALKMSMGGATGGFADAEADISDFDKAMALNPKVYLKAQRAGDLAEAKRSGRTGLIYSFEAATMLEGRLDRIDHFAGRGVRVMQLGYNVGSPFASGVLSPTPASGLTPLGRDAVARMNAQGVTLDLSHADEATTLPAIAASKAPALITHAGCAALHAHPRNKSDDVLRALADKGGTIGIYELCFLDAGPAQQSLDHYMGHMTHALSVCGEDHVGIGTDGQLTPFDTSPPAMAAWTKDIAARKAAGVGAPGEGRPPFVAGLNRPDRCEVIARQLL